MNILLVCTGGMSTSLIASRLEEAAEDRGLDITAEAFPSDNLADIIADYDVVLLGPQVKYKQEELAAVADEHGIPLEVIDGEAYGMMEEDKILDQALEMSD